MKKTSLSVGTGSSGFTLIELLVVITILAIISVVAYTQFGGVTDKAKNSAKLNDLTAIETGLNTFYTNNNYYPMPSDQSATNVWGYKAGTAPTATATIHVTTVGAEISAITSAVGGGDLTSAGGQQYGAKGVIDGSVLTKQYLSKELLDPSLRDIKVGTDKTFADYGIGKYIYAVYAKPTAPGSWNTSKRTASAFNLGATILDEQKGQMAVVTGNYDNTACTVVSCTKSLISDGTTDATAVLDKSVISPTADSSTATAGVPYSITNFK